MSKKNTPLKNATLFCEKNGYRFTDPRKFVLKILIDSDKPMGAYDVLEQLGQYLGKPKPPTAYRAIDFWRKHGFVHKIESLNAYMACCEDHVHNDTHFLVCDNCESVEELHHHNNNPALPSGFIAKRTFTETHGTCAECIQSA